MKQMREIIFRGKRTDNGEWIEGHLVKLGRESFSDPERYGICNKAVPLGGSGVCYNLKIDEVIPETVGQYTGLTDKNGKRIWENDIVKTKFGRLCKVVWRQTQCFVGWDFNVCDYDYGVNDFPKPPSSWDLYFPENLEVVGNSIDNLDFSRQKGANNELRYYF